MTAPRNDRLAPQLMYAFPAAHQKRDTRQKLDRRDEGGDRSQIGRFAFSG